MTVAMFSLELHLHDAPNVNNCVQLYVVI